MRPTDPRRGSIPPGPPRDQNAQGSLGTPSREQLRADGCRLFRQGGTSKADLLLVEAGSSRWIVKDFRHKSWWVRWTGRWMIARESRAYRRLGPIEGVPRFIGRIDAHALAVEHVEATPLAFAPERTRDGAGKLARLRAVVERIHRAGVVHCDLRGRDNVLVDREGRVWVVDFAGAIRIRPGTLLHKIAFRWLTQIDHAAVLKWKRIVEAGPFTLEERELFRRFRALRRLWFHRRRAWRTGAGPPG